MAVLSLHNRKLKNLGRSQQGDGTHSLTGRASRGGAASGGPL